MIKQMFKLFDYNTLIIKKENNGFKNGYAKMIVEIEGDLGIRRSSLTPRSTPVLLEFELKTVDNKNKNNLKCMVVDFELINDQAVFSSEKMSDRNAYQNLNGSEFESSVAYLNKTYKRVYIENGKEENNNDESINESKEVNLSRDSDKRCKRKMLNFDYGSNKITGYNNFQKILKLEEWLFGN
ncbi:hypothetical protein FG386_002369 [Cryptosporidium ryanae]|uniref:uncharacterized protein n=1 Tax=Cryptosporidium ryanae TaxID=515981 RepID=UPI003519E4BE|nr:hypothetical protein FG386_002369 [Cryptosporidium ryanae]